MGTLLEHFEWYRLYSAVFAGSCIAILFMVGYGLKYVENVSWKRSAYYVFRDCEGLEWEGMEVYIPTEDGNMGYYYLPATQHKQVLSLIELRGNSLKDGFKIIAGYENVQSDTSGSIR